MIGIIGGVGPLAGIDLFRKITEQTPANCDQEHLPVLLFSQPHRIKDRTEYLEGKISENPGIALAEICMELSKAGATVVGIPCNTAHSPEIFSCITNLLKFNNSSLIVINMVDETLNTIKQILPPKSVVGILATTGTYRQKIYFNKLIEAGFFPVVPDEKTQSELVHTSVYHPDYGIKTQRGKIPEKAKTQLSDAMNMMKQKGATSIILGCSEISLAFDCDNFLGMKLIDPTKILAESMIRVYTQLV